MDVLTDDMFMFAFCFACWLGSGLAVAGTGCCSDWLAGCDHYSSTLVKLESGPTLRLDQPSVFPPFRQGCCGVRQQPQLEASPRGQHPLHLMRLTWARARARARARALARRRPARWSRRRRFRPRVLVQPHLRLGISVSLSCAWRTLNS